MCIISFTSIVIIRTINTIMLIIATELTSHKVLRREAHDTLDPRDPMLDEMYRKKQHKEQQLKQEETKNVEKPKKRERLIVNPDFVENLDSDDGSVQYNEV